MMNNPMLRNCLLATIMVFAPMGAALADNDIGCGVGTVLWEGHAGIAPKVLAATTNGILGNQTFGISSGTLECQQGGVITVSARLPMYASANLDRIAADMAAGQGETLTSLAELYGIAAQPDRDEFNRMVRTHFASIFPSDKTTAGQMLQALQTVMAHNKKLAHYVS